MGSETHTAAVNVNQETGSQIPGGSRYVFSSSVFRRNCLLTTIVGCLLTASNQLDVLLTQPFSFRMGTKIFFNFLIPFVVSSTSALINRK
jgi:hypothetical protein